MSEGMSRFEERDMEEQRMRAQIAGNRGNSGMGVPVGTRPTMNDTMGELGSGGPSSNPADALSHINIGTPISPNVQTAQHAAQSAPTAQPARTAQQSAPSPMPATAGQPMSAQQQMMMRMRQQNGQVQQSSSISLEQSDGYNPTGSGTQQTQSAQTAQTTQQVPPAQSDTTINTTNTGNGGGGGFSITPTKALIIVGIVIVFIVVIAAMLLKNNNFKFGGAEEESEWVDPMEDPNVTWIEPTPDPVFLYTSDEVSQLRGAGYTGDEIEQYQVNAVPFDELMEMAEEKHKEYLESLAAKYDVTTPEFEEYISQTWLSLPERTDADEWTEIASYYEERKNFDYQKVEPHGNQLWLKIYLDDNKHENWFYLNVDPTDWMKLNDSGNVIVNYTYCTRLVQIDEFSYDEDTENIFITGATLEIIE